MSLGKSVSRLAVLLLLGTLVVGCNSDDAGENPFGPRTNGGGTNSPGNSAPLISGSPVTSVVAGQAYDFRPGASDPDGDTLSFSVSSLPGWASFDTASGRLWGTPDVGDVGTYADIVVSVSDGQAVRSLTAFAIDVTQVATGSATLSWQAPTQNDDGSPLIDLAGYRVYWRNSSGSISQTADLKNAGITSYVVEGLSPGTWYFALSAFNASGVEGQRSDEVSKNIG